MTVTHGKDADLSVNGNDISAYITKTGLKRTKDTSETTPIGGSLNKTFIPGLKDGTIPLDGNYDATVDGFLSTVYDSTTAVAFVYGPFGTTAGNVKYTGNCILTDLEIDTGTSSKGNITGTLQITGAVTKTVY